MGGSQPGAGWNGGAPRDWPWTSYLDMGGEKAPPAWLTTDGVLAQFATHRREAVRRYITFVLEKLGEESIWRDISHQIYVGDEAFVERIKYKCECLYKGVGVPKAQKRPPAQPLDEWASRAGTRVGQRSREETPYSAANV